MTQQHRPPHPETIAWPAASRRSLLGQAAKLTGAAGIALVAASPLLGDRASLATAPQIAPGDVELLHRLIDVEHKSGALFGTALARFTGDDGSSGDRLQATQPTLTNMWFHDRGHLALLIERLDGASADAAPLSDEQPPLESFAAFLWTASEMKNATVVAYVEAVSALENIALRRLAAGILAVEARHAAYLSGRIGEPAFTTETEGYVPEANPLADDYRLAPTDSPLLPLTRKCRGDVCVPRRGGR